MAVHTVVIGAGVIGLTTAYHLAREGTQVTVLDARTSGQGASENNAGWICPAEAAPVPGPGMVAKSLRWMMRRDSPLYIRPSLDLQWVKFMIGMWRRCNADDQRAGFEAHLRLAEGSLETFDDYRRDGIDFEMNTAGLLIAFTNRTNFDHHIYFLDLVEQYGRNPRILGGDEIRAYEPRLSDTVLGGIYLPLERHIDPVALMSSLRRRLVEQGVRIVDNTTVEAVTKMGDRVHSVHTQHTNYRADRYVLATGAWSGPLSKAFGTTLPIRAGKGYSIDLDPQPLAYPVNLSDAKVSMTPLRDRLRLAGTMEFGGLEEGINHIRTGAILRAPAAYLRDWDPPILQSTFRPESGP